MKKIIILTITIVTFIVALVLVPDLYKYINQKIKINKMAPYYRELALECIEEPGDGCCLYSVQTMEYGNYKLNEDGTCDDGFRPNMLKCINSYKWCEPIKP